MKQKIKEFSKKYLVGFIIGSILFGTLGVYAVTYFPGLNTTYDNSDSGMTSTNVQDAIDELYGVCTTPPTAGDSILDNTDIVTSGDGLYEDEYEEGKYTYKGANPNNYVTFNDEKAGWRIISINSDGTIKIMRTANAGNRAWATSGFNNWNRPASLNTYLNGDYYNSLTATAQSQIVEGIYYAGAVTWGNNDMQDQISDEKSVTSKEKVALPTLSEYIRAGSNTSCKTFGTYYSNYSTCKNSDWMWINDMWWTLSPLSGNSDSVLLVYSSGYVDYDNASNTSNAVRPAITLSSEVQITGGTGTQSDPYTIE